MSSPGEPSLAASIPATELRWTVWPVRDEPGYALLLIAASVFLGVAAGLALQSAATGAAVTSLLLASLWRMWVPATYEISSRGVAESFFDRTQRIGWREIARVEIFPDGFLLQAVPEASPLAGLRGTFVPWGHQKETVLLLVRLYGPRAGL